MMMARTTPRWLALGMALLMGAAPASARRYRRARPSVRPAAARPAVPAVQPVRNVILVLADGYGPADWRTARADAGGLLDLDRFPVTGVGVLPELGAAGGSAALARLAGTGSQPNELWDPPMVPLLGLAKERGKAVGLVADGDVAAPMPAFLAVPENGEPDDKTMRRLLDARIDVLFGYGVPEGMEPVISAAGYAYPPRNTDLLGVENTPVVAQVNTVSVTFEALCYRALHLLAKSRTGFVLGVSASASRVSARDLDAALTVLTRYAHTDGRTLVLLVSRYDDTAAIYADGASEGKFLGTLAVTDVPKILAGVAGLKGFRRDFSPFFATRSQATVPLAYRQSGLSLPW